MVELVTFRSRLGEAGEPFRVALLRFEVPDPAAGGAKLVLFPFDPMPRGHGVRARVFVAFDDLHVGQPAEVVEDLFCRSPSHLFGCLGESADRVVVGEVAEQDGEPSERHRVALLRRPVDGGVVLEGCLHRVRVVPDQSVEAEDSPCGAPTAPA